VGDQSLTAYFTGACDGFVAMSTPVAQDIQHFSQAPLLQLPHPINEGLGEKCDAQEARKALGLPPRGVQLLFFGLIRPYKGLDLLLEALARTELQTQDWHLVVAGEFYEDPRPYHELVQRLGLDQQVRFDEGFVPSDKIPLYFSAADLVTQTYRSATQSGITQMAYHFDCPMLVTEVGGLSEMVDDRQGGYVVPPEPASIAHAIDHFISRGKKEEFVAHVHEKKAEYRWEVFVDALLAFVSETKAVKTKR
jgi:glycosyltransferase involved in cell wall biosynthesis